MRSRLPPLLFPVWIAFLIAAVFLPRESFGVGEKPKPHQGASLREQVESILEHQQLPLDDLALLLFSVRHRTYLYSHNIRRPMIAASNAKLVTTYTALKTLSPDYRWRTRFFRIDENHDGADSPRQGLLVKGSGDPTLTPGDLYRAALYLKSVGMRRIDGGIYFDGRIFDDQIFPATWGDVSRGEAWFAPVSPFIVAENVIEFMISKRPELPFHDVLSPVPGFEIVSKVKEVPYSKPNVKVMQKWREDSAVFQFSGTLGPSKKPISLSMAVERPRVHFYRRLVAALRRAGITGEMPLRLDDPPPEGRRAVYQILSPPLREVIVNVNKHSSNLAAEVLLRTMGLTGKKLKVSAEDGLAVLRAEMESAFKQTATDLVMVDGSGLSRENRISALLLVRLLNRVRYDFSIRPEFINSLPVALTDGTLRYRNFPARMKGRLRAKSGSLKGVSNLSGYMELDRDIVIFSFLIHQPKRPYQKLQTAQDLALGEIFDLLQER